MTSFLPIAPATSTDRIAGFEVTATASTPAGSRFAALLSPRNAAAASTEASTGLTEELRDEPGEAFDTLSTLSAVPDTTIVVFPVTQTGLGLSTPLSFEDSGEVSPSVAAVEHSQIDSPTNDVIEIRPFLSLNADTGTTAQTPPHEFVFSTDQNPITAASVSAPEPLVPGQTPGSPEQTTDPSDDVRRQTDSPLPITVEVLPDPVPLDVRAEFDTNPAAESRAAEAGESPAILYSTDTRAAEEIVAPEARPLSIPQVESVGGNLATTATQTIDTREQREPEQDTTSDSSDDQIVAAVTQVNLAAPVFVHAEEPQRPVTLANNGFHTVEDVTPLQDFVPEVRSQSDSFSQRQAGDSVLPETAIDAVTTASQTRDIPQQSGPPAALQATVVASSPIVSPILSAVAEQNLAIKGFDAELGPAADVDSAARQISTSPFNQPPATGLADQITAADTQVPAVGDLADPVLAADLQNVPAAADTSEPETRLPQTDVTGSDATAEVARPETLTVSQQATVPFQTTRSSLPATTLTTQLLTPVIREAASVYQSNNGSLTVRLDPPELGRVEVHFLQREDGLHIRVEAVEAVTLEMLKSRGGEIERLLRVQELDIAGVEIDQSGGSQTDGRSDLPTGHQQRGQQTDSSAFNQPHPHSESHDQQDEPGLAKRRDLAPHRIRA